MLLARQLPRESCPAEGKPYQGRGEGGAVQQRELSKPLLEFAGQGVKGLGDSPHGRKGESFRRVVGGAGGDLRLKRGDLTDPVMDLIHFCKYRRTQR